MRLPHESASSPCSHRHHLGTVPLEPLDHLVLRHATKQIVPSTCVFIPLTPSSVARCRSTHRVEGHEVTLVVSTRMTTTSRTSQWPDAVGCSQTPGADASVSIWSTAHGRPQQVVLAGVVHELPLGHGGPLSRACSTTRAPPVSVHDLEVDIRHGRAGPVPGRVRLSVRRGDPADSDTLASTLRAWLDPWKASTSSKSGCGYGPSTAAVWVHCGEDRAARRRPFSRASVAFGGGGVNPPFELDNRNKRSVGLNLSNENTARHRGAARC